MFLNLGLGRMGCLAASLTANNLALNLDFMSGAFPGQVTFARASDASEFNASGLLNVVTTDVARLTHNPATLARLGYLNEPQSTNLCLWSEDLNNGVWTKGNASVNPDVVVAPDGATTADVIVENTAVSAFHYIAQAFTKAAASTTYILSGFCSSTNRDLVIYLQSGGSNGGNVRVRPSTGVIVGAAARFGFGWSAPSATFTDLGGGECYFTLKLTSDALTTLAVQFALYNAAFSYTGDGTSGVAVWGVQLVAASIPSSYAPTAGASATRAADDAQVTGATFSSAWSAASGAIAVRGIVPTVSAASTLFQCDDGTANNRISLQVNASGKAIFEVVTGGVTQCSIDAGSVTANTAFTLACRYGLNDFAASLNGAGEVTDVVGTVPTVDRARLGASSAATSQVTLAYARLYRVAPPLAALSA